jgi:hypothetical protein
MDAMETRSRVWALAAALALLLPACDGPFSPLDDERDALEAAQRTWRSQGITSYEFRLERICFCIPARVLIRVQDQRVVSVTSAETGAPATPDDSLPLTVEALFTVVDRAIDLEAHNLEVDYDDSLGYPLTVGVDVRQEIADDETYYQVSDLRPLR